MSSLQALFKPEFEDCETKDLAEVKAVNCFIGLDNRLNCLDPLSKLPKLEQLSIVYNMREFTRELGVSRNLRVLSVLDTNNHELPDEVFTFEQLEVLRFRYSQLVHVNPRINQLTAMKVLDLDSNILWYLPEDLSVLTKLEVLSLRDNEFHDIPETIFELCNLEVLDMSYNHLLEIPKDVVKLSKLKSLIVTHNKIAKTPVEMQHMPHLAGIDASYNRLTNYPLTFNIEQLLLEHNLIDHKLPRAEKYTKLRQLNLGGNQLDESLNCTYPPTLEYLDVSNTKTWIPEKRFCDMGILKCSSPIKEHLKKLFLAGCGVESIASFVLDTLPQLELFVLDDNDVTEIDLTDISKRCPKLAYLSVNNNKVTEITGSLRDLPHLDTLLLRDNTITAIDEDLFKGADALKYVSLNKNEALPKEALQQLQHLPQLETVELSHCGIDAFPTFLGTNPNLKHLDLSGASFQDLDPEFPFAKLQFLSLKGAHLQTIPEDLMHIPNFLYPDTIETYPSVQVERSHSSYTQSQTRKKSEREYDKTRHPNPDRKFNYGIYMRRWPKFSDRETLNSKTVNRKGDCVIQ